MQPTPSLRMPPQPIPHGTTLVSKTDLQGRITYANDAFVEAYGYPQEELIGSPHQIVRHPDMPAAQFADLWGALQNGRPWQGLLLNRSQSGHSLWVDSCIVPIRRQDKIVGYMSAAHAADPEAIAAAQQRLGTLAHQGTQRPLQSTGFWGVRNGVRVGTALMAVLLVAGGLLGLSGLQGSDAALNRLYHEQFEPAAAVGQVEAQLNGIRARMLEMQLTHSDEAPRATAALSIGNVQNAFDEIHDIFAGVALAEPEATSAHTEASASAALAQSLKRYATEGRTLLNQAVARDPSQLPAAVQQQLLGIENKASLTAHALRHALMEAAQQELSDTLHRNARIRTLSIAGMVLGLLLIAVVGHLFIRSIVHPLNAAIHRLHRIAEGDLQGEVRLSGSGETAQLNHAAVVMQQHLKVMLDEIALAARRIRQHCQVLYQSLQEVTEHSEAQHDQVHAAVRALHTAVAETSDLSLRAERLMGLAAGADSAGDVTTTLEHEARELATATRLTAFGAEEVAGAMREVAHLIVENRSQAQLAWQASEQLMHTAGELNELVDFFAPPAASAPGMAPAPTVAPAAALHA